jgi:hypothetical protein
VADCAEDVALSVAAYVSDCADAAAASPARVHAVEEGAAETPSAPHAEEEPTPPPLPPPPPPFLTSLWPFGWRQRAAFAASTTLTWGVIAAVLYTYVRLLTLIGDGVVVHLLLQPHASKSQARARRSLGHELGAARLTGVSVLTLDCVWSRAHVRFAVSDVHACGRACGRHRLRHGRLALAAACLAAQGAAGGGGGGVFLRSHAAVC